jgi:hypothetical protein
MSQTDGIIFTSAAVTLGSTVAASAMPADYGGQGELPAARLLIGTSLGFIGISIMSEFAPQVAVPLAAGIALTALTYYGIPILDNYFNKRHNVFSNPVNPTGRQTTKADHLAGLPGLTTQPPKVG